MVLECKEKGRKYMVNQIKHLMNIVEILDDLLFVGITILFLFIMFLLMKRSKGR